MSHGSGDISQSDPIRCGIAYPRPLKYRWAKELEYFSSPEGTKWILEKKPDYSLKEYLDKPRFKRCPDKSNRYHAINPLKEAAKAVATVGASTLGFALAGLPGAMVAGCLASGSLSAIDSKLTTGRIDPWRMMIDGTLGAIPAGWRYGTRAAGFLLKGGSGLATILRGVIQGAIDGSMLSALQTTLAGGLAGIRDKSLDVVDLGQKVIQSAWYGAIGGGLLGGVLNGAIGARRGGEPIAAFANQTLPADRFVRQTPSGSP